MLIRQNRIGRGLYGHNRGRTEVIYAEDYRLSDSCQKRSGRWECSIQCSACHRLGRGSYPLCLYDYRRWRRNLDGVEVHSLCAHCVEKLRCRAEHSDKVMGWHCMAGPPCVGLDRGKRWSGLSFRRCWPDVWSGWILSLCECHFTMPAIKMQGEFLSIVE